MRQSYIDICTVATLCLLYWSPYIEAEKPAAARVNCSTASVENVTELMELTWDFSNENFTDRLCEVGFWLVFQCNFSLMESFIEIARFERAAWEEESEYYSTNIFQHLENAIESRKNISVLLQRVMMIPELQETSTLHTSKNESICSRVFLYLENQLAEYIEMYHKRKDMLLMLYTQRSIILYYSMPFLAVWSTCGMVGNGLLLFIFVRHSETRSGPNALLVNLAVSNTLFLMISAPIEYLRALWGIPFRTYGCYMYHFLLTYITATSVYSMTALSFMRYVAITVKIWNNFYKLLVCVPVMLSIVCISSSLVAIPDTLYTVAIEKSNETYFCSIEVAVPNSISNFIFIAFLPLLAIMFFYISASKRLQDSVCNMPGESMGHEEIKKARKKGAKILPAQAYVFAITYLPFYTYWLVELFISVDDMTGTILYVIIYMLFNLNPTLNPIALYLVSSMFRNYFHKYLSLRHAKKQTTVKSSSKCYVSSTEV